MLVWEEVGFYMGVLGEGKYGWRFYFEDDGMGFRV